jgi:rubrerythrin
MSAPTGLNEILDFAIEREQEAVDFYTDLAGRMGSRAMKDVFAQFAQEERGHKAKLQAVQAGKRVLIAARPVADLKLADYLVAEAPGPDMDYRGALLLAMQREKAAFRLYSDLAADVPDAELREIFLALAQEEAKHKLRFEIEYDEQILKEG